jgi:FkbM family methyltransferase
LVQLVGLDVRRFPGDDPAYRRVRLIRQHGISHVFDVGGSDGRFGLELRRFGYQGQIVSFEPLESAYRVLARRAAGDPRWNALPYALGSEEREVVLKVTGNAGASSSILTMMDRHLRAEPGSACVGTQAAKQFRLDDLWSRFADADSRIYLKIDTQGYEVPVLDGAAAMLERCIGLQLELSFVPLYEGSTSYLTALAFLSEQGFTPAFVEPGFSDPETGECLQADFIAFRDP